IKSFVSTEAAHSTAAFLSVKLFFEEFFLSTQRLALSVNLSLHISGRRILQRFNSLSTPLFSFFRTHPEEAGDTKTQPGTTLSTASIRPRSNHSTFT
ncbi:hypothetical protein ACPESP_09800, partial [Pseudomonas solani]